MLASNDLPCQGRPKSLTNTAYLEYMKKMNKKLNNIINTIVFSLLPLKSDDPIK